MTDRNRTDPGKELTVVIADGFDKIILSIKDLLELEGDMDIVGWTTDAEGAIGMLEKLDPDVVVIGLMRSERDGLDLARRVNNQFPQTGIVFISVYNDGHYREEAECMGVREYVALSQAGQALALRCVRRQRYDHGANRVCSYCIVPSKSAVFRNHNYVRERMYWPGFNRLP